MPYSDPMLPRATEVVVIGGGIIGTSVAYYLTRRGREVCLIERDGLAAGASGANIGLVALCNKMPDVRARLIWESAKLYDGLADELGWDIEYRRPGGIMVFTDDKERIAAERLLAGHRAIGLPTRMVDAEEVKRLAPHLHRPSLGALYSPLDGYVNPYKATVAFARAARRLGATVVTHCLVQGIEVRAGRIVGVRTSRGRIAADIVVNAAGAWAAQVGRMVSLEVPVTPCRGQVMISEPTVRLPEIIVMGVEPGARQVLRGGVLVGSTPQFVGYDLKVDYHTLTEFAREVLISFPDLARLNIIRTWAGLRPASPDDLPILGPGGPQGFFLATGHYRTGVAMAPASGKIVAEMIDGLPPSVSIDECAFTRFAAVDKQLRNMGGG